MKYYLLAFFFNIGKILLNFIYFFMKLAPRQNKVVFLSRQSNQPTLDFRLLQEELVSRQPALKIVMLCKMVPENLTGKISYGCYLFKCMSHLATAKVGIVDSYCIPVSILRQRKNLTVIQLWHALGAVKKFGYQSLDKNEGRNKQISQALNMHRHYDYVICASQATGLFLAAAFNIDPAKITVLGMPRIDRIKQLADNAGVIKQQFATDFPERAGKKNILYAPTFRQSEKIDVSSLSNLIDFTRFNLLVKLHPLDQSAVEKKYLAPGYTTFKLLQIADYIITDYSALLLEASLLTKPVYLYVYDIAQYQNNRGLNIDLLQDMSSCTSCNPRQIVDWIEQDNYDFTQLQNLCHKFIETNDRHNCQRISAFILSLLTI